MTDFERAPRRAVSRRHVVLASGTVALAAVALGVRHVLRPADTGPLVTPPEAQRLAQSTEALLIDIRRPDEWHRTGLAASAVPLDMRRDDFEIALAQLVNGDRDAPVILICAGGVRSRWMTDRLAAAGFTNLIDVPEGMLGSRAGPGWIARGLPTVPYQEG